jgi:hypothetical protein
MIRNCWILPVVTVIVGFNGVLVQNVNEDGSPVHVNVIFYVHFMQKPLMTS